jgi:hypothetical protein
VQIPPLVTTIGKNAFANNQLTNITIRYSKVDNKIKEIFGNINLQNVQITYI